MITRVQSAPRVAERPIDAPRGISVRVIGAGISGMLAAIKLREATSMVDIKIYEKNKDLGGTWYENRYPGCACDIPAHIYQLSFDSNVAWSKFYAGQAEILRYWQRVAEKYNLRQLMHFSHRVTHAQWLADESRWEIEILNELTGETIKDSCHVLISAVGLLNAWKWPDIPGLEDFQGAKMHSAAWDADFDPQGKDVAVIGAGSSGIQIVPSIQGAARRLDHYVRGQTWIATPMAAQELAKRGVDAGNFEYTDKEIKQWQQDPESYLEYRKQVENTVQSDFEVTLRDSALQQQARGYFQSLMAQRLKKKPEILKQILPSFAPLCKRLTPGPGYLEALSEDNVEVISSAIKKITKTGIETADGHHREVDAIICATGFNTSFTGGFPIVGLDNQRLFGKSDRTRTSTYLSMMVDTHPNLVMLLGPNSGVGAGNLLIIMEHVAGYIAKLVAKMQRENILSIRPSKQCVDDFTQYCESYFERTVYSEVCPSWYKADGKVAALWPGSSLHAIKALSEPRWEDFEYSHVDDNGTGWLGNGCTLADIDAKADKSYYLKSLAQIQHDLAPEVGGLDIAHP